MAGVSSISTSSSIDLLVNRFLDVERKPIQSYDPQIKNLNTKISVFTDLKSELTTLFDRFDSFTTAGTENTLASKTAVSSDESLFTVDADSTAVSGVYSIKINQLAKNDTAVSKQFSIDGTELASRLDGRTVQFKIGIGSETPTSFTMSFSDSSQTNEEILRSIAREINGEDIDVSSTVIKDTPSTVRLTILSKETGSSNNLNLTDVNSVKMFNILGFHGSSGARRAISNSQGGFVNPDTDNLSSQFTINGINIVGDSNTVTDVLLGVTVTLRKAQDADDAAETITISGSSEDVISEIEDFIEDYNQVLNYMAEKTKIDTTTYKRGILTGNFTVRNLMSNLRTLVSSKVTSVSRGNPQTLTEIGLKINNNGTLEINNRDKLTSIIESDVNKVTDLFNSDNGIAVRGKELLRNYVSVGGTIDDMKKGTQARLTGLNKNVSRMESRLTFRENTLRRNFSDLQRTLSRLNTQSALLQRIYSLYNQSAVGGYGMYSQYGF